MTVRILIAAVAYVPDEPRRELVKLCYRVIKHLNPGVDVVVIDAPSPFDPKVFLPGANVFSFDENVGAINRGGRDGAGRALCKAIEIGIEGGYDYVVHHETDFILARPVTPIIERMHKADVGVASPGLANPYAFLEWGAFFISTKYAQESRFIERYDWEHNQPWPLVELKLEQLFGDDLFLLPLRGIRNDMNQINVANIGQNCPYGLFDWMTHTNMDVLAQWLTLLGIRPA